MLTMDIDTGNIPAYVDVVNISRLARQCNPRWGNSTAGTTEGGTVCLAPLAPTRAGGSS
jgi:hypothetical protein